MTDFTTLFPQNPSHGMLFELQKGLFYQFDISINSWIKIASSGLLLPLATDFSNGAMAAVDLKKLNRLLLPPPVSTIIGTDCVAPFRQGFINLYSGDNFVNVDGTVEIKNVNAVGDKISESVPFHIHEHTYGFDFSLDVQALVKELIKRNQFNVVGKKGDDGDQGLTGDDGIDNVLSGPAGEQGDQGLAPSCDLSIEPEIFNTIVQSGLKRALTKVTVEVNETNKKKYNLVFERQAIGLENTPVSQFNVKPINSSWLLAVENIAGNAQSIYYIDIDPIIETIHLKFLDEVNRLKKGYEDIVKFWIQTMSDLFDEQKRALCCALEFCVSATKSTQIRQHVESVAAAAAGSANISIHNRNDSEAIEISSTGLLSQINSPDHDKAGGDNLCLGDESSVENQAIELQLIELNIDPLINSSNSTAYQVDLAAGKYVAIIKRTDVQIDGKHHAIIKLSSTTNGVPKIQQFLNKGSFISLSDSKQAYEGLTLPFSHDGGIINIWLQSVNAKTISGNVTLTIQLLENIQIIQNQIQKSIAQKDLLKEQSCYMTTNHLRWYQRGWDTNNCCGFIVNLMNQDYIIFKRSLGNDLSCGGGESTITPCIGKFSTNGKSPAFAWPTLDKQTFVQIPDVDDIEFKLDNNLTALIIDKLEMNDIISHKGNNIKHSLFQIENILFPIINED